MGDKSILQNATGQILAPNYVSSEILLHLKPRTSHLGLSVIVSSIFIYVAGIHTRDRKLLPETESCNSSTSPEH